MENETLKLLNKPRQSSVSSIERFSQCSFAEDDLEDPISAYFKKRCETSKSYHKKLVNSDSDSSIGFIDVDSGSFFGDEEEKETDSGLRKSFPITESLCENFFGKESGVRLSQLHYPDADITKQRDLARKTLQKFNEIHGSHLEKLPALSEKTLENSVTDCSNNINGTLLSNQDDVEKPWFQPHLSPDTPRFFKDELSSFGGENSKIHKSEFRQNSLLRQPELTESKSSRLSAHKAKISSILKDIYQLQLNDNEDFKSQTKEEQIQKLEEDERVFKLENSGLLHNSSISQFSGINEGDFTILSSSSNLSKAENRKLSIGQFFNIRSNRVSSLIGFDSQKGNKTISSPPTKDTNHCSTLHEQSLPVSSMSKLEKSKPRRCISTFDLKPGSDASRYSSDSTTSNSTVDIHNILAEMESGLSGTQIYEKLIKAYGMKKIPLEKKGSTVRAGGDEEVGWEEPPGNKETPKSSKNPKRQDCVRLKEIKRKEPRNFRLNLDRFSPDNKSLENRLDDNSYCLDPNKSISIIRHEKIRKLKGEKGFDASTPKTNSARTHLNEPDSTEDDEWEVPKVSSIQPAVDVSAVSEDNEKTLTTNSDMNSGSLLNTSKRNRTIQNNTRTIEDTIVAGDLTVLSQRIEEMKGEGVCISRSAVLPEEPVLLTVVQKLADLPKGSVNCSSLAPLIREQFPELLSSCFPTPSSDKTALNKTTPIHSLSDNTKTILVSEPGCWVESPAKIGFAEKLVTFVDLKKIISVPVSNISKYWLLVSVESVVINHLSGGRLSGVKKNDEWNVCDFAFFSMKDCILPPESQHTLEVVFCAKIESRIDAKVTFLMKQLLGKDVQSRSVVIKIQNVNPLNGINVIPKDSINFGVIADQCSDERTIQLTVDGACDLPLVAYLDEEYYQSSNFRLKPVNSGMRDKRGEWKNGEFRINFREGEKQLLEFLVVFSPNALVKGSNKVVECTGTLVVKIDNQSRSEGVIYRIPIKGSVGSAKFLWNSKTPLVFRVTEKGQPVTRNLSLRNVGNIPIAFSITISNDEKKTAEKEETLFVAPKTFYLSKNEESSLSVTFNGNTDESCVKRLLLIQVKPNGKAMYELELIGIVSSSVRRPLSRTSHISASSKSLSNTESAPVKLLTTTNSLSWASVPLEKESKQTFQLKNASSLTVTARITFKNNLGSFKLVDESGEKVQKIRKVLKPGCPFNLTVTFRPDSVGSHHNALLIETNQVSGKKMILLNGIGGMPNLFIGNIKSDLNGCKMIALHNKQTFGQIYANTLEFKNEGRIPGFILIRTNIEALSLSHELTVTPPCCIIPPNSRIVVKLSQKLKNDDIRQLLTGKDISKLATLSVIMGDEPSRLRLRKLIDTGKIKSSERSKILTSVFDGEKAVDVNGFEDSSSFENQFLKSLKVVEVAVVVERSSGICEPTILVDEDETIDEFVTVISAADDTIKSSRATELDNQSDVEKPREKLKSKPINLDNTIFSMEMNSSDQKISKWLESMDRYK